MYFTGIIAFICIIPLFIFGRLITPSSVEIYPEYIGLSDFEIISLFISLIVTLIFTIIVPYIIIINENGIFLKYVFRKNKLFEWKEISKIKIETQLLNSVGALNIMVKNKNKRLGAYRMIIFGDIVRYYDRTKILIKEINKRD